MTSKRDSSLWDDGWGALASGGKQEENAAGKGQVEATGTDYFFGYQYLFAPAEAPCEQHTVAAKKSSEYTHSTPDIELRSGAERSVTPGRRKGERRKGNRRREREGKREQKDTDINKKRWYQSKSKERQGQSPQNQPQNTDDLLEEEDRPQTDGKINWLQVQMPTRKQPLNTDELLEKLRQQVQKRRKEQKQSKGLKQNEKQKQNKEQKGSEEQKQSKEQKQSEEQKQSKDKDSDGTKDHAPDYAARPTNQSATDNDSKPTNGKDSTGDNSLPFLKYFWSIEPLEEAPSLVPKSAAILEARGDEGVLSEKSSLQKDDEAPSRVHRVKRWFSTIPQQGDFGSSLYPKTVQDRSNGIQGPRLEERDLPGGEFSLKNYGSNVEAALEEEDYSKSRNCMSFRRNQKARGSGMSFSRVLSKLSLDPEMDKTGKKNGQGPRFEEEDVTSRSVEDAPEEEVEDFSKSRNCMSFRRNPEARGSGSGSFLDLVNSKSSLDPKMDQSEKNDRQGLQLERDVSGRALDESRRQSTSRLDTLTGGIFSGRALDESRREPTSRRDTLTIEEEEAGLKDTQLVTVVHHNGREGSREEIVLHEPNKEQDDDEQEASQWPAPRVESRKRGEHERAARRNWLARHGTLDQDYGANVDDALEEKYYSGTRNCMSFRRNPSTRGGGIFLGRLDESRRESTSRRDTLPIEKEEMKEQHVSTRDVSPLQDVSRQEQDRALPGKERRPSSLPATKPTLPAKERSLPAKARQTLPAKERSLPVTARQSVPILQSRSEIEERVQPQSPKGAAIWRGDIWGLISLSVDSLDAEESTRLPARKPIRINRAASKKKSPADICSIRAASWDSYDDEECYSNSSASSVFSLESLEAW